MQIFKTKDFGKRAESEDLTDEAIASAMREVRDGLVDAALGGDLYKKRIAIGGNGKSGGVRSIIAYKDPEDRVFCLFVFPKNKKANIAIDEKKQLKLEAKVLLNMGQKDFEKAHTAGALIEVPVIDDEDNE